MTHGQTRPKTLRYALFMLTLLAALTASAATEDEVETRDRGQVRFARGASSAVVRGRIGRGLRDQYLIRARPGQVLTMRFESADAQAGFDVFVTEGLGAEPVTPADEWQREWSGRLPRGDEYYINVGTRGAGGPYSFEVRIENARRTPQGAAGAAGAVPRELRAAFANVKREAGVAVLLPSELPTALERPLYASGGGRPDGYDISLAFTPGCGGANACTAGFFGAERGGTIAEELEAVELGGGVAGRYKPLTCGASCSAPSIEWAAGGVLYTIQLKLNYGDEAKDKAALVALAASAIEAGPR